MQVLINIATIAGEIIVISAFTLFLIFCAAVYTGVL